MLFRFRIELSNIDREIYQSLDFRVAQHPSETLPYLLSRVIAYILSYQEDLEFSPSGLGDPEAPALRVLSKNGAIDLWIEIGNPSAKKLHKAGKKARQVVVYTYKSPRVLLDDIAANDVHRASELQIFSLDPKFLQPLEAILQKNNRWVVLFQQGRLDIECEGRTFSTEIELTKFTKP